MRQIDAKQKPANSFEYAHLMPSNIQVACLECGAPVLTIEQSAGLFGYQNRRAACLFDIVISDFERRSKEKPTQQIIEPAQRDCRVRKYKK